MKFFLLPQVPCDGVIKAVLRMLDYKLVLPVIPACATPDGAVSPVVNLSTPKVWCLAYCRWLSEGKNYSFSKFASEQLFPLCGGGVSLLYKGFLLLFSVC